MARFGVLDWRVKVMVCLPSCRSERILMALTRPAWPSVEGVGRLGMRKYQSLSSSDKIGNKVWQKFCKFLVLLLVCILMVV